MTGRRNFLPVADGCASSRRVQDYVSVCEALEGEFALASALIEARAAANLTQEELANRMGTTQPVIARMGGGKVMPSTRTLARLAAATGTKLRISFEPPRNPSTAANKADG